MGITLIMNYKEKYFTLFKIWVRNFHSYCIFKKVKIYPGNP